ncbi:MULTISPECIES: FecCD family ABC transporter permease [Micrococcales]|uniref:Iron ABC transporter permease n=1 Tax=Brevibacterium aurantiacum TaxID=273384 RepID=A0A2A3Z7W6_BREAU|nr:iron chelate uptake ABC transporter family permease subunit [Brevibacterium aurantiacum]MDN5604491.1 iron chelate uptake ABC transporter family permease subunit [Kocuria sp.]PCC47603.1 iron ABC transporter permease [Brevibacterium aurantiacum]RCS74898.1 iron ABC transporter permease [Brachybacterium alimentarium]SLN00772.1 ABC-type Fe3+-siderophore transport system, permease component [Corynebacterium xerosis]
MTVTAIPRRSAEALVSRRSLYRRRSAGLLLILAALVVAVLASFAFGANPLSLDAVWRGLWQPDDSDASTIVWTLRIPRTIVGLITGAAFGASGALIQALTRNPLADPGILGVNAGAGFAVTLGVGLFGLSGVTGYIWFAFIGAAFATTLVYLIGSAGRGTASPVTLVLAGVALSAVLGGFSTFLTLIDKDTFRSIRNWGLGSIARTSLEDTMSVLPFLVVGLILAVILSGSLNSIALGDDLAASLGTKVGRTRVLGIIAVTLLAGGATALTGGIGFVGLMVPHIVRWFVGPDQRWIILYSALAAPTLVLAADVLGRVVARPGEIEVGIVTAVIGAPVLIALVRRRKASGL